MSRQMPMRCDEARAQLQRWTEPAETDAEAVRHAAGCAQVDRLSVALVQALRHDPPAALTAALLAHAQAAALGMRPAGRPFWLNVSLTLTAVAAALTLLFWPSILVDVARSSGWSLDD